MRTSKKIVSLVLAVMMVATMLVVGTVAASAAGTGAVQYTTLAGAVSTVTSMGTLNSGTYTLLEDHTETGRMAYGLWAYDVTIDLNGHTFTSTATDCAITMGRAGTASENRKLAIIDSVGGGKFVNNSVSASDASDAIINVANKYNAVTIDAAIEGTACGVAMFGENQTLNVTGGSITVNGNDFAIATNGSNTTNPTINISGGEITSTGAAAIYQPANGTLNISGGTITGETGVYVKSGTTNITGGTIKGTGANTGYSYNGSGANSTGAAIVVDNCGYPGGAPVVSVDGGVFESDNAAAVDSYANGTGNEPVEDFITGGVFLAEVNDDFIDATPVEVGGVKYVGYDNVITAVDEFETACAEGGKYVLGADIELTSNYYVASTANLELDLADKTITVATPWDFANYGTLTVTGTTGKITASKGAIDNYGTLVLKGGTIEGTGSSTSPAIWNNAGYDSSIVIDGGAVVSECFGITSEAGCSVTMNSGSITSARTGIANYGEATINGGTITADKTGISVWKADAVLTVNGGTISGGDQGVSGNGSTGQEGYVINVNGGTIIGNGDDAVGIYHPNFGTLNVTGGTIKGATGIYVKAGETAVTTISNAIVIGNGEAKPYEYSGSGCNPTGDAIVIDNCGYPGGAPNIAIAGGSFVSDEAQAVSSYATGSYEPVDDFVTGGSFSDDSAYEFVASDVFVVKDANGNTKVSETAPTTTTKVYADEALGISAKNITNHAILGYQNAAVTNNAANMDQDCVRIITAVNEGFLKGDNIADYGYVVAKYNGDLTNAALSTPMANILKYNNDNFKTISCYGTSNTVASVDAYGDFNADSTYKFVTLAIGDMNYGDKVIARFYIKTKDGKVYYSQYQTYSGILATYMG